MNVPDDRRYTEEHEWVRTDDEGYTVGITAFAAEQLGDVTYVEPPEVGADLTQGAEAGTVESVKAASDVYAPVGGQVAEINAVLEERPELVNESPYEEGWFFKLTNVDRAEVDALMDSAAYTKYVEESTH